jgi:hypothetical protein
MAPASAVLFPIWPPAKVALDHCFHAVAVVGERGVAHLCPFRYLPFAAIVSPAILTLGPSGLHGTRPRLPDHPEDHDTRRGTRIHLLTEFRSVQ